jgi:hypothetical protein
VCVVCVCVSEREKDGDGGLIVDDYNELCYNAWNPTKVLQLVNTVVNKVVNEVVNEVVNSLKLFTTCDKFRRSSVYFEVPF